MWDILAKLVVNVDYYQGEKRIFSVDTIAGGAFAVTGIKYGAFAVNVNTRTAKHFYNDLISVLVDDAIPTTWLVKKVLEEEVNYANALKRLKRERIGAPVYYIISGV